MIAVWAVGISFTIVGLIVCLPRYIKFIKCTEMTKGTIVETSRGMGTGSNPSRATYEYYVNGEWYRQSTGWTNYSIFGVTTERNIRYNPKKPQQSYMKWSGQIINCFIGTVFAVIGIGVLIFGAYLKLVVGL